MTVNIMIVNYIFSSDKHDQPRDRALMKSSIMSTFSKICKPNITSEIEK